MAFNRIVLKIAGVLALIAGLATAVPVLQAAQCNDDAILVFDASGSMRGTGFNGVGRSRIDKVREAIREVLPQVAPYRNLGLIVYGPGPKDACSNIELRLSPAPRSAQRIMSEIDRLTPDGNTPLTEAVRGAANILNYRERPAVIVLLTDGEETCGGAPCALATRLKSAGRDLTVHVIGFRQNDKLGRIDGFRSRCFAHLTGGHYLPAQTVDDLIAALRKTLTCPFVTQRRANMRK